jgi:hypothetical protein
MWWVVAGSLLAVAFGLEARRLWRDRIADRSGLTRYALYAVGHDDHALRLIEVGPDAHSWQMGDTAGSVVGDPGIAGQIRQNSPPVRTVPSGTVILPFRSGYPPLRARRRPVRR